MNGARDQRRLIQLCVTATVQGFKAPIGLGNLPGNLDLFTLDRSDIVWSNLSWMIG
jgi:hypothetical protein